MGNKKEYHLRGIEKLWIDSRKVYVSILIIIKQETIWLFPVMALTTMGISCWKLIMLIMYIITMTMLFVVLAYHADILYGFLSISCFVYMHSKCFLVQNKFHIY